MDRTLRLSLAQHGSRHVRVRTVVAAFAVLVGRSGHRTKQYKVGIDGFALVRERVAKSRVEY